jgi:hypothetical protein
MEVKDQSREVLDVLGVPLFPAERIAVSPLFGDDFQPVAETGSSAACNKEVRIIPCSWILTSS